MSSNTGRSPQLRKYYAYWEGQIFGALQAMVSKAQTPVSQPDGEAEADEAHACRRRRRARARQAHARSAHRVVDTRTLRSNAPAHATRRRQAGVTRVPLEHPVRAHRAQPTRSTPAATAGCSARSSRCACSACCARFAVDTTFPVWNAQSGRLSRPEHANFPEIFRKFLTDNVCVPTGCLHTRTPAAPRGGLPHAASRGPITPRAARCCAA